MRPSKTLANDCVHLWCCPTPCTLSHHQRTLIEHWLSPAERTKIARYRSAQDSHQSLISRAMIREACSYYLGQTPEHWKFSVNDKGKPKLANSSTFLAFNLSHTSGMVILALSKHYPIGVDVEQVQRQSDTLAIAKRYFSATELNQLKSYPEADQQRCFFDFWTLKEAYIKACGQGLAIPLDHFSFNLSQLDSQRHTLENRLAQSQIMRNIDIQFHHGREDSAAHWQHFLFNINPQYRAALSVHSYAQHPPITLQFFNYRPLHPPHASELPISVSAEG